jgi:hypothetical protein
LAEVYLLSSLPFFFFFVSSRLCLLIVAFVPVVFGFSVHLLGCHCPLSFGCAIFECGGVSVSTRSTLTTLVTLLSRSSRTSSCSKGRRDTEKNPPCAQGASLFLGTPDHTRHLGGGHFCGASHVFFFCYASPSHVSILYHVTVLLVK